jgi:hypothetical protein
MGAAGVVAAERFIGRASIRRTRRPFLPNGVIRDLAAMIARNTIRAAGQGVVVYEPSTILQANAAAISAPNGAVERGT